MELEYRLLLFDVDGTLIDTSELIYQAFEYVLALVGVAVPTRKELILKTGKLLEEDYRLITGITGEKDVAELCTLHRAFQNDNMELAKAYPRVVETLEILGPEGYKLAAVSTRSRITAIKSMKKTKVYDPLKLILTAEDVTRQKPDPESIEKSLKYFGVDRRDSIIIGDRPSDIEAGKRAGIATVGVTYGFSTADEIWNSKPDSVIENFHDLLAIVRTAR